MKKLQEIEFRRIFVPAAEKYPNVKLNFNHKLIGANLNEGKVTLMQ